MSLLLQLHLTSSRTSPLSSKIPGVQHSTWGGGERGRRGGGLRGDQNSAGRGAWGRDVVGDGERGSGGWRVRTAGGGNSMDSGIRLEGFAPNIPRKQKQSRWSINKRPSCSDSQLQN